MEEMKKLAVSLNRYAKPQVSSRISQVCVKCLRLEPDVRNDEETNCSHLAQVCAKGLRSEPDVRNDAAPLSQTTAGIIMHEMGRVGLLHMMPKWEEFAKIARWTPRLAHGFAIVFAWK